VLEIGTGSGFSTALLGHLDGSRDAVFSVDVDPEMSERTARLLQMAGPIERPVENWRWP
jgi:protein-L-isoaspartate O-methyltransferase